MNRQNTEELQGIENTLYDTVVNIYDYTFIQTHRLYTRNKPQSKLWTSGDYYVYSETILQV